MTTFTGKRVLVVDDELHLRLFIKAVFETAGNTVEVARDGKEGLAKAIDAPPDLITLDLMMPKEGGIQMYRRLKEDTSLKDVPVMIVSAVDSTAFSHAIKLLNAGQTTIVEPAIYIGKPPKAEELLEAASKLT